jgi:hypothetical protein
MGKKVQIRQYFESPNTELTRFCYIISFLTNPSLVMRVSRDANVEEDFSDSIFKETTKKHTQH